jgi:predicted SprT family Zn-dependent metalloprotease
MENENFLLKYLGNKQVVEHVTSLVYSKKNLQLIVRNPRKSFYGNMIYSKRNDWFKIYINQNLSPSFFLYVFLHEYAHVLTHLQFGLKVKPHGKEWQNSFFMLLQEAMDKALFENNIHAEIEKQFFKTRVYSNLRDSHIKSLMDKIDLGKEQHCIKDIPLNSIVLLSNNMKLKIEKKIRTRYVCADMNSKKKYLVPGFMAVKEVIVKSV